MGTMSSLVGFFVCSSIVPEDLRGRQAGPQSFLGAEQQELSAKIPETGYLTSYFYHYGLLLGKLLNL